MRPAPPAAPCAPHVCRDSPRTGLTCPLPVLPTPRSRPPLACPAPQAAEDDAADAEADDAAKGAVPGASPNTKARRAQSARGHMAAAGHLAAARVGGPQADNATALLAGPGVDGAGQQAAPLVVFEVRGAAMRVGRLGVLLLFCSLLLLGARV